MALTPRQQRGLGVLIGVLFRVASVLVKLRRQRRRTLLAGLGVLAAVVLVLWWVPPALSSISSRRYADAVEVGTRVVLAVAVVVLGGAALDRARRRWWWWAAATLGVLIGLTAVVLLFWLAPPALYKNITSAKDRASAEATTRTGLIAGLAGLAALGGLAMTTRTYRLTEQGQITDRYTKAIEQLGDDKLAVRLGGIYALERIARDSKRDHPTVAEVLSVFVRERTDPARTEEPTVADVLNALLTLIHDQPERNPTPSDTDTKIKLPADVQAAISVLGRLPSRPGVFRGDLTGAHLTGADLCGATLTEADLRGADLTGAELIGATLTGAWLMRADLSGANLLLARLTGAELFGATLTGAKLFGATLTGADLRGADLAMAKDLTQQQLNSARGDDQTKLPAVLQRPAHWSADPAAAPAADE